MKTYFCDSYSPQQKPLVEKMNSEMHEHEIDDDESDNDEEEA